MIHPGSLLSRNPPQLNFTLTDISLHPSPPFYDNPPFFSSRPPSSMKRRQPSIRLPEIARPFVSSIDQRRYLDSWKHFEGTVCVTMMMMTSWPFSTTILSFDEWGDGSPVLEQISSEFGKLESLRSSLHWNYSSDREIEIDFRFILRFKVWRKNMLIWYISFLLIFFFLLQI